MHPILFQIGDNFFIGTYGVMIAIGVVAAIVAGAWRGRKVGISTDQVWDFATVCLFSGLIGARLTYIFINFGEFLEDPFRLIFSREGFVFLGGLGGATVACLWFLRRQKISPWLMSDLVAVSLPLAHAFGRIGCHLAGCCFGGVCDIDALAIRVPYQEQANGEVIPNAFSDHYLSGLLPEGATHSLAIWPIQLIESGALFALAGLIAWYCWSKPRPTGMSFGCYLVGYGVLRFSLEFLRGDVARGLYFGGLLSFSQIVSIGVFVSGLWVLRLRHNAPIVQFRVDRPIPEKSE